MENRIRELRKKAGLSLEALAKKTNTTRATIMKLEKGSMQLTSDWMQRIADALHVDWVELLREIPQDEKALLEKYNRLQESERAVFEHMLDSFLEKKAPKKTATAEPESYAEDAD